MDGRLEDYCLGFEEECEEDPAAVEKVAVREKRGRDEAEGTANGVSIPNGDFDTVHVNGNGKGFSPENKKRSVKDRFDPKESQQKRREELLEIQQSRRDELFDKIRQLETESDSELSELEEDEDFAKLVKQNKLVAAEPIEEDHAGEPVEGMDTTAGQENQPGRGRRRRQYKMPGKVRHAPCRVMLSEWLDEKPQDFEDNWIGVFVPVGKRCLVVARKGKTFVFSRTNQYMGVFQSYLPGGRKLRSLDPEINRKRGVTILDCIWSAEEEVFYVLDLVAWNSNSMTNCDKQCRQFMLNSKFEDHPALSERTFSNQFPFKVLPTFSCESLTEVMMNKLPVFQQQVDGVIFFHKESFYYGEINPLCLWIYLTDVEEKIQVSVAPELVAMQRVQERRPPREHRDYNNRPRNGNNNKDNSNNRRPFNQRDKLMDVSAQ